MSDFENQAWAQPAIDNIEEFKGQVNDSLPHLKTAREKLQEALDNLNSYYKSNEDNKLLSHKNNLKKGIEDLDAIIGKANAAITQADDQIGTIKSTVGL